MEDGPANSIKGEINDATKAKKISVCESNAEEFIDMKASSPEAAKCSTKTLDRELHIRSTAVDNQDGPLGQYLVVSSTAGKLVSPHGGGNLVMVNDRLQFDGLEERVRNIETHLGIVVAPLDRSLVERVKVLEDKILKIEEFYPQIAAHVFNYGKAEAEASLKPGGRVSRFSSTNNKKEADDIIIDDEATDASLEGYAQGETEDPSLGELKRRMDELKQRLLKQAKGNNKT